jgi:Secretion system C-terminal sorting domain
MKKYILLFTFSALAIPLFAQICFSYDAAGNRKQRISCANLNGSGDRDAEALQATLTSELLVFPNPSNGSFQLQTNAPAASEVFVTDLTGRLILRQPLGDGSLDLRTQPNGTYLLSINAKEFKKSVLIEKIGQ